LNLFDIAAKISLDSNDFEKGINSAVSMGKKAAVAITSTVDKITNIGETAAKIVGGVSIAAAGGVAALTKNAVDEFAEYEQLVGGAELMFGDAYGYIAEKSANAYATVQMSQNQYLQQVNGFATGLKTALGGNEQAAAELADRILRAEADIVAATGNSQEAVQNAFNGIMKSNYSMLDNLQIGITPTKEGFQEIINKVNEWNKANGSATKYQISNLADAQSALLDYIDMIGMTGYAANEASGTISGSTAAMRAAWKNLLIGLSDDTQDMDVLVDNFVQSAMTAADNILPRVKITLSTVANLAEKYSDEAGGFVANMLVSAGETAPELIGRISGLVVMLIAEIQKHKGELRTGVTNTFAALLDGFEETLDAALPLAGEFVPDFVKMFLKYKTTMFKAGVQIIVELAKGLSDDSDELADAAVDAVEDITGVIADNLDIVLDAGYKILESLANALLEDNPELESNSGEIIQKIVAFAKARFPDIVNLAFAILGELATGLADSKNLETLARGAVAIIGSIASGVTDPNNLSPILTAAITILGNLAAELTDPENLKSIGEKAPEILGNLGQALEDGAYTLGENTRKIVENIQTFLTDKENQMLIKEAGEALGEIFAGAFASIIGGFFGMSGEDVQSLAKFLGTTTQEHFYNQLKESIDYTASIDTGEDLSYTSGQKKMDDFIIEFNERVSDGETPEKRTPTNITIQQNFYGGSQTAADLMQEARYEAERSVLDGLSE
jgi:hypothetical protein